MMNMKEMLGEAGRTLSNRDMAMLSPKDRFKAQQMMGMSDNEPMMQDRSPENQMFSIDAQIENLMKSYNMLVNANEFGRAQEVADQIDQLQQQKIGIQGNLADMAMSFDSQIGSPEFTKGPIVGTISNQDREIISSLLESISE
jgi:thiamine biosynthesis protein ThiC